MPDRPSRPPRVPPPGKPTRPARFETRLPCPVCLVMMDKAQVTGRGGSLTLDHCTRCGGVWFEKGEVQQLAASKPSALWAEIAPRADTPKPLCQKCQTPLDRDAEKCGVCGRSNDINCPHCDEKMKRRDVNGLVLDLCERCHGVWFDHKELNAVWTLAAQMSAQRRSSTGGEALAIGGDVLMSAMFWTPGLVIQGAAGAAHLGGAAIEAAGGAAEGVFEAILGFISAIFDGN
jgi:Zn-finger nucleic acid-binding protein